MTAIEKVYSTISASNPSLLFQFRERIIMGIFWYSLQILVVAAAGPMISQRSTFLHIFSALFPLSHTSREIDYVRKFQPHRAKGLSCVRDTVFL